MSPGLGHALIWARPRPAQLVSAPHPLPHFRAWVYQPSPASASQAPPPSPSRLLPSHPGSSPPQKPLGNVSLPHCRLHPLTDPSPFIQTPPPFQIYLLPSIPTDTGGECPCSLAVPAPTPHPPPRPHPLPPGSSPSLHPCSHLGWVGLSWVGLSWVCHPAPLSVPTPPQSPPPYSRLLPLSPAPSSPFHPYSHLGWVELG